MHGQWLNAQNYYGYGLEQGIQKLLQNSNGANPTPIVLLERRTSDQVNMGQCEANSDTLFENGDHGPLSN